MMDVDDPLALKRSTNDSYGHYGGMSQTRAAMEVHTFDGQSMDDFSQISSSMDNSSNGHFEQYSQNQYISNGFPVMEGVVHRNQPLSHDNDESGWVVGNQANGNENENGNDNDNDRIGEEERKEGEVELDSPSSVTSQAISFSTDSTPTIPSTKPTEIKEGGGEKEEIKEGEGNGNGNGKELFKLFCILIVFMLIVFIIFLIYHFIPSLSNVRITYYHLSLFIKEKEKY